MTTHQRRPPTLEERQERERAWSAEQKKREKAWTAQFEKRQREQVAEAVVTSTVQEREAWAKGERAGQIGYVDVTGPDDRRVRLAVVWLGRYRATAKPLNVYDPMRRFGAAFGEGILVLIPIAALVGLDFVLRSTVLRLLGRPRWAVAAAVGPHVGTAGNNLVLRRCRSRREALRYAAAVADNVERDGAAALTPR
ncbi:hypothetical protein ACFVXG_24205 [Kitasatospora sp. NPDC058162]|uniref:hypothetical protein n=1 Tax=Kitasatospora sp. NPDC058162 TaxID=3346362 RepID=UPI0036D7D731